MQDLFSKKCRALMLCLEVWRKRRVEGNDYPPPSMNVFKIKGERNN